MNDQSMTPALDCLTNGHMLVETETDRYGHCSWCLWCGTGCYEYDTEAGDQ